ncbi:hypothetical protein [Holdemania filiformis]|uniref:hypothetical protein n=1 Tax=Holdemania filiformis TaxID=61171 RepID=UPI0022E593BD|nr:hypothetical protein [Holdemania filiformis]
MNLTLKHALGIKGDVDQQEKEILAIEWESALNTLLNRWSSNLRLSFVVSSIKPVPFDDSKRTLFELIENTV